MSIRIHPTAEISSTARIGEGTSIWHNVQIREGAQIGKECIISKGVYIDTGVVIGDRVKIQNYVSVYHGVTLANGVFIGPHVCFTNDLLPRAINPDGSLKSVSDWVVSPTFVETGASIGANSTIRCGITIGEWALIGAGSVVTTDVPDHGQVWGNPARLKGFICSCGGKLLSQHLGEESIITACQICSREFQISRQNWENSP